VGSCSDPGPKNLAPRIFDEPDPKPSRPIVHSMAPLLGIINNTGAAASLRVANYAERP
jgi:hypothetical protein